MVDLSYVFGKCSVILGTGKKTFLTSLLIFKVPDDFWSKWTLQKEISANWFVQQKRRCLLQSKNLPDLFSITNIFKIVYNLILRNMLSNKNEKKKLFFPKNCSITSSKNDIDIIFSIHYKDLDPTFHASLVKSKMQWPCFIGKRFHIIEV